MAAKKKPKTLKDIYGKTWGAGGKSPAETMKPKQTKRSMNALDKAISEGKTLPSKNKKYPGDTDVKTGKSKGKPIIRPNVKPAPMPKGPKNKGVAKRPVKPGKKK